MEQTELDSIADSLEVKYGVIDNLKDGKLTSMLTSHWLTEGMCQ